MGGWGVREDRRRGERWESNLRRGWGRRRRKSVTDGESICSGGSGSDTQRHASESEQARPSGTHSQSQSPGPGSPASFPAPRSPPSPKSSHAAHARSLFGQDLFPATSPQSHAHRPSLPLPCPRPATALLLSHTFSALPSTQPPHSKQTGEMWSTAREIAAGDVVIAWMVIPAFTTCLHTLTLALSP